MWKLWHHLFKWNYVKAFSYFNKPRVFRVKADKQGYLYIKTWGGWNAHLKKNGYFNEPGLYSRFEPLTFIYGKDTGVILLGDNYRQPNLLLECEIQELSP
jgi:hypothetical protein